MSTSPRRTRARRPVGRWRARLRLVVGVLAVIAAVATFNLAAQAVEAVDNDGDAADLDADQAALLEQGEQLYGSQCVMCHGRDARGAEGLGPTLANQGAAAMDFVIRTGRMPLANADDRPVHQEQSLTDAERRALVAYIPTLFPPEERGPEIPDVSNDPVDYEGADLAKGLEIYTSNCAACHGPTAAGIAVGRREISSNLDVAQPLEIAQAIRIGPGVMPLFSTDVLDEEELRDVTAWVLELRSRESPGGASIGRSGPVVEGLLAWTLGLGALLVVMWFLGDRAGGHQHEEITDAEGRLLDPETMSPIGQRAATEGVAPAPANEPAENLSPSQGAVDTDWRASEDDNDPSGGAS